MQVSEIEFPHVIYFTYSSLGLIWQLSHYNYQKKKKTLPLYKCISIFPSQYKHSCEPITSKFKSWLFLSLALLENVERHFGERLPSSVQRSFYFLFLAFFFCCCFRIQHKWDTFSFPYYCIFFLYLVIIGVCFACSFEYIVWLLLIATR